MLRVLFLSIVALCQVSQASIFVSGQGIQGIFSKPASGGGGSDITIGSPANGLSLVGDVLTISAAGAASAGAITTGAQTIAGLKTFSSAPIISTATASKVAVFDSNSGLASSSVSTTTLGFLDATSSIQTQLDAKAPLASPTFSGTITTPLTASRVLTTNGSSQLAASSVSTTTLGYLDATSSIQTQLDAKQASGNYITALTGEVTASGPGSASATLSNSAVIGKVLTGYSSSAGTLAATDTILQGFNKLNGNVALKAPLASPAFTGTATITSSIADDVLLWLYGGSTTSVTRQRWANSDGTQWFELSADFSAVGDEHWSIHSQGGGNQVVFHKNGQFLLNGLGTSSLPKLAFWTDRETGIMSGGDGKLSLIGNTTELLNIDAVGNVVTIGTTDGATVTKIGGAGVQGIGGSSTSDFAFFRSTATASQTYGGGTSASNGSAFRHYGGTHATKASQTELLIGGSAYTTWTSGGLQQATGGSVSGPSYSFGAGTGYGMWYDSSNTALGFSANGTETLYLDSTTVHTLNDIRMNSAGTSATTTTLRQRANTGAVAIYGGASSTSAIITLYGSSHGTKAGQIELGNGGADFTLSSGQVLGSAKSASAPTYSFGAFATTGMYASAGPTLNFATGGTRAFYADSSQIFYIPGTTDASSSTSGIAVISGGVGIAKKLYVGTDLNVAGNANIYKEYDAGNSGTSKTLDFSANGYAQKLTLTGNVTLTFTAPPAAGSPIVIRLLTGAGSFTVTWPASVKWASGTAPTITTTASRMDLINLYYDGTNYYGSYAQNFTP